MFPRTTPPAIDGLANISRLSRAGASGKIKTVICRCFRFGLFPGSSVTRGSRSPRFINSLKNKGEIARNCSDRPPAHRWLPFVLLRAQFCSVRHDGDARKCFGETSPSTRHQGSMKRTQQAPRHIHQNSIRLAGDTVFGRADSAAYYSPDALHTLDRLFLLSKRSLSSDCRAQFAAVPFWGSIDIAQLDFRLSAAREPLFRCGA